MGKQTMFTCDRSGCSQIRSKTNHWWEVFINESSLTMVPLEEDISLPSGSKVYCSAACVQRELERFMGNIISPPLNKR